LFFYRESCLNYDIRYLSLLDKTAYFTSQCQVLGNNNNYFILRTINYKFWRKSDYIYHRAFNLKLQLCLCKHSFPLQLPKTWYRTSSYSDGFLHMGRTANQRSGHRIFNNCWVHPDHSETYKKRDDVRICSPLYPNHRTYCNEPWNDLSSVVPHWRIKEPSIRNYYPNAGMFTLRS